MIEYMKCNDYLVPALCLEDEEYLPLGKYGMLRETYLREHHRGTYTSMLLTGRLQKHLAEIDQAAREQVDQMMAETAQREGITEALKAAAPMRWVQLMNSVKASAEEVVLQELIYAQPIINRVENIIFFALFFCAQAQKCATQGGVKSHADRRVSKIADSRFLTGLGAPTSWLK